MSPSFNVQQGHDLGELALLEEVVDPGRGIEQDALATTIQCVELVQFLVGLEQDLVTGLARPFIVVVDDIKNALGLIP